MIVDDGMGAGLGAVVTDAPVVGSDVVELMSWLLTASWPGADDNEVLDEVAGWQRLASHAVSQMWAGIGELRRRRVEPVEARAEAVTRAVVEAAEAGRPGSTIDVSIEEAERLERDAGLAERSLAGEVALALGWSRWKAQRQVVTSARLIRDLPSTYAAVVSGALEPAKAEVICTLLAPQPDAVRARVEELVLPGAIGMPSTPATPERPGTVGVAGWTLPELRDRIKDAVLRVAPEEASNEAAKARTERRVWVTPKPGDMMLLNALIPVEDGAHVVAALSAATVAAKTPDDERTAAQRRLDVLVDALIDTARPDSDSDTTAAGERKRRRPPKRPLRTEIGVTVPFGALAGDVVGPDLAEEPGHLDGYGPIAAETARRLAAQAAEDGAFRCALTDDHGTVLGIGRSTFSPAYEAPELLKRLVNYRDRVCTHPGCRTKASECDFEHAIPWGVEGGVTCECDGHAACRACHLLKTLMDWQVRRSTDPRDPPGTWIWKTPFGREYANRPAVLGIPRPRDRRDQDARDARSAGLHPYLPGIGIRTPEPEDPGPPPY